MSSASDFASPSASDSDSSTVSDSERGSDTVPSSTSSIDSELESKSEHEEPTGLFAPRFNVTDTDRLEFTYKQALRNIHDSKGYPFLCEVVMSKQSDGLCSETHGYFDFESYSSTRSSLPSPEGFFTESRR